MAEPTDGIVDRLVLEVDASVKRSAQDLPAWLGNLAALAAAAVTALAAVTYASAATADASIKAARAAGISVEEYTALAHAAGLAGVSTEALAMASRTVAVTMAGAAKGAAEYADAYRLLGIDVEAATARGATFAELLPEILDGLKRIPEPTLRTATAMKVLGEAGAKMATLVEGGGDALRFAMLEAQRFGLVISTEAAVAAEKLNDDTARLTGRVKGLALALGLGLTPAADRLVVALSGIVDAGTPAALAAIEATVNAVTYAIGLLLTPLGRVVTALGVVGLTYAAALSAGKLAGLAATIPIVGKALAGFTVQIGAATTAALPWAVGLGLVALALEDVNTYLEGGDSFVGRFAESIGADSEMFSALSSLLDILVSIKDAMGELWAMAGRADDALAESDVPLLSWWARASGAGRQRPGQETLTDARAAEAQRASDRRSLDNLAVGAQALTRPGMLFSDPEGAYRAARERVDALREARMQQWQPRVPASSSVTQNVEIKVDGAVDPVKSARFIRQELDRMLLEASGQVVGGVQ